MLGLTGQEMIKSLIKSKFGKWFVKNFNSLWICLHIYKTSSMKTCTSPDLKLLGSGGGGNVQTRDNFAQIRQEHFDARLRDFDRTTSEL